MSGEAPTTTAVEDVLQNVVDNADSSEEESASSTPFLDAAGVQINFQGLAANPSTVSEIPRLAPGTVFNNGMVFELQQQLSCLFNNKEQFFNFIKALVPEETASILEQQTLKKFKDKMTAFNNKVKSERKTPTKFQQFLLLEYKFGMQDRSKQTEGRRKRCADSATAGVVDEKKQLLDRNQVLLDLFDDAQRKVGEAEVKVAVLESELEKLRSEKLEVEREREISNLQLEEMIEQRSEEFAANKREKEQLMETHKREKECLMEEMIEQRSGEFAAHKQEKESLMEQISKLRQSVKGLKSGKARARSASNVEMVTVSAKSANTDIRGIRQDLVVLDTTSDDGLSAHAFPEIPPRSDLQGHRYYGYDTGYSKRTSGNSYTYFEVAVNSKPASKVTKREVHRRARFIDDVNMAVSGPTPDEKKIVYTELIKQNEDLFKTCLKDAGLNIIETLSPEQTINIQSLLRLSNNKVRNFRICMSNYNINLLASERQMRKKKKEMTSHVDKEKVESGFIGLLKTKNEECVTPCAYVRVKDIVYFLEEILEKEEHFNEDPRFGGKWWLMFGGDKGGDHMKYHVEVINTAKAGSVDNVHLYCMFEANDTVENMRKVWLPYHKQVKQMQEDGFLLHGKEVSIFLGGDYHFLDDNLGHQGSSATFPSSTDKVLLSHLQNHGGFPHTPDNCPTELRTAKDYFLNYNENLADDRSNHNMHENGKHHNSVVGPFIFPVKSMDQVVPASLHILLGTTLLGYNLLNNECKKIDGEFGVEEEMARKKAEMEQDWEIASYSLSQSVRRLEEHGQNVVTMTNLMHRHEAVIRGDVVENDKLASLSEVKRRKKKRVENELCASVNCIITTADENIRWVQCDNCDSWYHTMCEVLTPIQEMTVENGAYKCLKCSGDGQDTNTVDVCELKIAMLVVEEEDINVDVIVHQTSCDNHRAKYKDIMGRKERELSEALESIHVIRQAYHGNVMVGNHCVIVLKEFPILTAVLQDETMQEKYDWLFSNLSGIMKLVMARRFLDTDECVQLKTLCHNFGEKFPIVFPERNITRKIHEMIFNIPRFVEKWGTVGLLSEQEGESMHAVVKAELRSLACVRNHAERLRLVIERDEIRSSGDVDKSILRPKPRLCSVCKEQGRRSFLRSGNDCSRHCRICEPLFFSK